MKKLFLILAAAAFMVACAPKAAAPADVIEDDATEVVDEVIDVVVLEQPASAAKPATPKAVEPKAEEPVKEEPVKEEPVKEETKKPENKVKGGR